MADYSLSAEVIGAKELQAALSGFPGMAGKAISDALNKTALVLEAKARSKAPHKTGALWNSIHTELAHVTATNIEASVGTDLVYARAQEYGTQGMVINSRSRAGNPFSYIGNIRAKFYMRNAKDETKGDLISNLRAAMQLIVASLATRPA